MARTRESFPWEARSWSRRPEAAPRQSPAGTVNGPRKKYFDGRKNMEMDFWVSPFNSVETIFLVI